MNPRAVCTFRMGGQTCQRCGLEKPVNQNASGPAARLYAQYQRDQLPSSEPGERSLLPDQVLSVSKDVPRTGWRIWVVGRGTRGLRLLAPFRPDPTFPAAVWRPGANEASTVACWAHSCRLEQHPSPRCWCGFRAMTSEAALWGFYDDQERRIGPRIAMAQVDLWGRVVGPAPGDDWQRTIRASHAQIVGPLLLLNASEDTHAELADHYGAATGEIT